MDDTWHGSGDAVHKDSKRRGRKPVHRMPIEVRSADAFVTALSTRQPFGFGETTVDRLPHVFVTIEAALDGDRTRGIAADHAIPKWFVKDPQKSAREDIEDIIATVQQALAVAEDLEPAPTVFDAWRGLYRRMQDWAAGAGHPPLLATFGASFVERALIEAHCRTRGVSVGTALRRGSLGLGLGDLHPELADRAAADLLPEDPCRSVAIRHTVGLSDPLTEADVGTPAGDGLPESLAAYLRDDGVDHVKCKVAGDPDADLTRLRRIADVLETHCQGYVVTLDANEQYCSVGGLRELWRAISADDALTSFRESILCVEQPLAREVALTAGTAEALAAWPDRPPLIVDESDGRIESCRRALACGYAGTSHKNCKGVFKGVANACLLEHRRRTANEGPHLLTAEDLTTIGPVSLLQDMAAVATLGIMHAERNGHHYFRGLAAFPEDIQAAVLAAHGDLYRPHDAGFPTLAIEDGRVPLDSVVDAPFGVDFPLEPSRFTPLSEWSPDRLGR